MKRLALHIFIVLLLFSCNKEKAPDCFTSTGPDETETRELSPFSRIEFHDYIQVKLVEDTTAYFAKVTAGKNLLDKIVTQSENGILTIDNENTCRFVRSFKRKITVEVHGTGISELINYGQGEISCGNRLKSGTLFYEQNHGSGTINLNVEVDSLSVICHTGVGDVHIKGTAESAGFFNGGYGIIDASNLESQKSFVNNSSINDVHVKFENYLFATINNRGNIYYDGPLSVVDIEINGTGELISIH